MKMPFAESIVLWLASTWSSAETSVPSGWLPSGWLRSGWLASGWVVAALLAGNGVLWAVMFFGPLAHLTHLAGGLTPFDIRPRGYKYAEARAFLEAIGEKGRRYYASPELVIDTFYPPLYAVSRGLALWWLTMPGRVREAALPLKVRYGLVAVPVIMASLSGHPA